MASPDRQNSPLCWPKSDCDASQAGFGNLAFEATEIPIQSGAEPQVWKTGGRIGFRLPTLNLNNNLADGRPDRQNSPLCECGRRAIAMLHRLVSVIWLLKQLKFLSNPVQSHKYGKRVVELDFVYRLLISTKYTHG